MKYMLTYDLMETIRNTNQWMGATARAYASYPIMSWGANPAMDWLKAWGEVTERTFERMVAKPDWNLPPITGPKGKDHPVEVKTVVEKPFGDLIRFNVQGRKPMKRRSIFCNNSTVCTSGKEAGTASWRPGSKRTRWLLGYN